MRRRRQKNTLLPKMLGIAVLVNAILLPILAQLGVFKTVEQHLQPVQLVNLPPPEKKPPPPPPKKAPPKHTAKPRPQAKVAARQTNTRPSRPNPNQPHVVAAAAPAGSGAGDNTIDNSGTGMAGQVPTEPAPAPPPPAPVVTPPAPAPPVPEPPSVPHVPALVAARAVSAPRPDVPDDLRDSELHAVLRGVFTVHADGSASFRVTQGTGHDELDRLASEYARRWTFQPATQDGAPVDSFLRVEMRFDVNS